MTGRVFVDAVWGVVVDVVIVGAGTPARPARTFILHDFASPDRGLRANR